MPDEAGKADGAGPAGEVEELPTMPPAPGRDRAALRWATPGRPAPARPAPGREEPTAAVLVPPSPPGPAAPARSGPPDQGAEDEEATAGGGGRHRRLFALLVLVGALCALAGVAVVVVWRVGQDNVARSRPPVSSPAASSPRQRLDKLLSANAAAGTVVEGAVERACRPPTPGSGARALLVAELRHAGGLYDQVLLDVKAEQVALAKMPAGRALSAELVRATEASVQAARAYGAWLEDLQATGCYSAPTNDIHYRAAAAASLAAGRAERQLPENPPGTP